MLSNPISDERFKGLIKSMSNYKPNKDIDRPDLLVRHLIDSNKALQKPGVAMCEKNDKRNALIELNMNIALITTQIDTQAKKYHTFNFQ
jgi:hypothetical protein